VSAFLNFSSVQKRKSDRSGALGFDFRSVASGADTLIISGLGVDVT